jgi:hypothetical protein
MAPQTILTALETWPVIRLLGQGVENDTSQRIKRGQFDEASIHPRDGNRIVEKDSAGVARLDQISLQAGLRENRNLRLNRNMKSLKQGSQVALWAFELKQRVPSLKLRIQDTNGI